MRTAPTIAVVARALVRAVLYCSAAALMVAVLSAQCTNPTPVTQSTVNGSPDIRDNNALATTGTIDINGGASVTFVAGNCIHLAPGFRATAGTAGTTFHAWVETAPSVISAFPTNDSGLSRQFTWTVASPAGYSNLAEVHALFNTSINGANACYIRYNRASHLLSVADSSGTNWSEGIMPGDPGTTGAFSPNCTINGNGSSVTAAGTQLAVTASVTFQSSFSGDNKGQYLIAYDNQGLNTGWQPMGTWTVPGPPPDFTVTISPITPSVVAGAAASYAVTVSSVNGFAGRVTFVPSGLPGGALATFNPSSITGSGSTTMTVATALGGVTGNFSVAATGISGFLQRTSVPAALVVQDFTITLSPGSQTVPFGGTGTLTVTAGSVNGYSQPVTLFYTLTGTAVASPPNPVTPGVPVSFSIAPTVGAGSYVAVQIRALGGGINHYTSANVLVSSLGDFSLTPTPSWQTIPPPGNASYLIAVNSSNNFSGPVDLSLSGLPPGVTASFTPSQVTPNGSTTLTVNAGAGALPGTYPLTITGWNAAPLQRTQTVWLVIAAAADFTLTSAQTSQTVAPPGSAGYSILVSTSGGFNGTVGLSASGLPAGASAMFSPSSVNGAGSSGLTVTTTSATPLGTFPITITGQSGSKIRTTTVLLTVGSATPATIISPAPGSNLTSTSRTFLWNPGGGASQYQLTIGSVPGASDYFTANVGSTANAYCPDGTFRCQSATVNGIPIGSQQQLLYARLSTLISGSWQYSDYEYHAGPAAAGPTPAASASQAYVLNDGNESAAVSVLICNNASPPGVCITNYCDTWNAYGQCTHYTNYDAGNVGDTCGVVDSSGASDPSVSVRVAVKGTTSSAGLLNSYDVRFTAGSSAKSGSRTFKCQYNQQDLNPLAFTVYDATPHINSVVQDPAEEPGGSFYIVIYGRNFGAKGAGSVVSVCAPGTNPCTSASRTPDIDVNRDAFYSFWHPDAVKVLLTPSPNAAGPYVVQLTTSGAAGDGFQSGAGSSNQSNQGQVTVIQVAIAMKMQIEQTVISRDGNYSEDTTIRVTAVDANTHVPVPSFNGVVNIAEDGTSIYAQNWQPNNGGLPLSVTISSGGTNTFVARSLAGPKTEGTLGSKPSDALIKTTNYATYVAGGGTSLSVPQWIISDASGQSPNRIDLRSTGPVYDWLQWRVKDLFTSAGTDLATVLGKIESYSMGQSINYAETTPGGATSTILINPYFLSHRLDSGGGTECGHTPSHNFKDTLYHEARHAYQTYLGTLENNDFDADRLVKNVPIAPSDIIVDSTTFRTVCNLSTLLSESRKYHGDQLFDTWDTPDFVRYAREMDAIKFVELH